MQATLAHDATRIDEVAIEAFRPTMQGAVIVPGDDGYDEARRLWNGLIDKRPAVIARCTGVADVMAALAFAREQGLPVAIRGGGHNVAGTALNDGGLVIDLSQMKGMRVDPKRRIAWAEPGLNWAEFDRETQVFGLATPGGEVAITGVAGLTLGGGFGQLRRKHGLTSDNLLSVNIVTADGEFLTASETENADLFWGIRGGGRNLGVVTSFEFQLHPIGPKVFMGNTWYLAEDAETVFRGWREFTLTSPDEVTTICTLWSVPALPDFPSELHGRPVVIVQGSYAGSVEDGRRALKPLSELATPLFDASGELLYVEMQNRVDPFLPDGRLYYWKSVFMDSLTDDAMAAIIAHGKARASGTSFIATRHLGGAVSRVPEAATAYGNRAAQYLASFDASWDDPSENDANIAWSRRGWSEVSELTNGGTYVNFAGFGEEGEALQRSIHGANYERLAALKQRYDPSNLFRSSLNLTPAAV